MFSAARARPPRLKSIISPLNGALAVEKTGAKMNNVCESVEMEGDALHTIKVRKYSIEIIFNRFMVRPTELLWPLHGGRCLIKSVIDIIHASGFATTHVVAFLFVIAGGT